MFEFDFASRVMDIIGIMATEGMKKYGDRAAMFAKNLKLLLDQAKTKKPSIKLSDKIIEMGRQAAIQGDHQAESRMEDAIEYRKILNSIKTCGEKDAQKAYEFYLARIETKIAEELRRKDAELRKKFLL
jgi:hypothetical protein